MKEFTKKQFLTIIQEENELDEMGQWTKFPEGGRRIFDPEMKKSFTKGKGTKQTKEKQAAHIGFDLLDNPENPLDTPLKRIIFTKGIDLDEFKENNEELLEKLEEEFEGDGGFFLTTDSLPYNWPYQKSGRILVPIIGGSIQHDMARTQHTKKYEHSGEKYSVTEKIRRTLYPTLRGFFNYDSNTENSLVGVFEERSLPLFHMDDELFLNREIKSEDVNNEKIKFETHSFAGYENADNFLNAATQRMTFDDPDKNLLFIHKQTGEKEHHLPRQYNKKYTNYSQTKKTQQAYKGLTPVYGLDKYRLESKNIDVILESTIKVDGVRNGNEYIWVVTYNFSFGRKRPDEKVVGNLRLVKSITSQKSVNFEIDPQYGEFNEYYTVMDNVEIKNALIEVLSDLGQKIEEEITSEVISNLSSYGLSDIERYQDVSESIVERAVRNVIKEIMRKK